MTQTEVAQIAGNPAVRTWRATAWVSGLFCLVLALGMAIGHLGTKAEDPLKSPQLKKLKETLRANPMDETTKKQIRALDLQVRQTYFLQLSRMGLGVYLLIGGAVVFVFATRQTARLRRVPPMPQLKADINGRVFTESVRARWSVVATGVAITVLLVLITFMATTPLPRDAAQIEKLLSGSAAEPAAAPDAASVAEMKANWPAFRGFRGTGYSLLTNVPLQWDATNGTGILWKVPSPAPGFNSPLVWRDRMLFSGGDEKLKEVFCFDAKSGQVLWRQAVTNVPGAPAKPPEVPDSTGYAASSMATDGRRVYAVFASGEVAAFTIEGKPVWVKYFGPLKNPYGHATSLATWQDRLLLQLDQGESEEGKSKLCALDGRTGQALWTRARKVGASWASPIVIEASGKAQVITLAIPAVVAYSVADGTELWKVECLNGEVTPSPSFGAGLVFVASPSEKLLAIRPDGQGDVTKSKVAWETEDSVPDVSSPSCTGELVFMCTTSGLLTCLDAVTGKKVWEHDFEMEVHASPVVAGPYLYVLGQKGTAVVVEAGREYKELFRTQMPDAFHATPAFAPDKMFLRGVTNIWCIGK